MNDDLRSDTVRVECPHCLEQTPLGIVRAGMPTITRCERCGAIFAMNADDVPLRAVKPPRASAD